MKYTFMAADEDHSRYPQPQPATKFIPEWYKKMPNARCPHTGDPKAEAVWTEPGKGLVHGHTMKQCVPVLDYLTAGYIVPLWTDLTITLYDGKLGGVWPDSTTDVMRFHLNPQFTGSPIEKQNTDYSAIGKLMSPWLYKTPKGYSSFFFSPRYIENEIEILPAIVDTDTYHEVNFPFVYHGTKTETTFDLGTPVIQVIPFKRDNWTSEFEIGSPRKSRQLLNTVFSAGYRKFFHKKKTYK